MPRRIPTALTALAATILTTGLLISDTPTSAAPPAVVAATLGAPPQPTKNDKPYKPTRRDKAALKGNPDAFTTFSCPCYKYAIAEQGYAAGTTANGLAANLPVENTFIKTTAGAPSPDYHVLAQLAVQDTTGGSGQQAIEFGITRDASLFGDWQPRLFAGPRKNGTWGGYGTAFVDYAPNTTNTYGTAVTVVPGTQRRFEIKYSGGNWWLAYDLAWIGYIQGSYFTNAPSVTFTSGNLMRAFLESVGPNTETCSDTGNGLPASNGSAARLGSINATGHVPSAPAANFTASIQPAGTIGISATAISTTTTRAGGEGADSTLTALGTTGSC